MFPQTVCKVLLNLNKFYYGNTKCGLILQVPEFSEAAPLSEIYKEQQVFRSTV